jgi:beta-phosphoglucomutase
VTVRAVIFDFNGTISDDEPLLDRLFREVLATEGIELSSADYFEEFAGLSDPEIIERALERGGIDVTRERRDALLRAKVARYKEEVAANPTIAPEVVELVQAVAERVPVAIASGAFREEVEFVLERVGLDGVFAAIVCIDDVERGKPDPTSYLDALAGINDRRPMSDAILARDVVAIEDSDAGVAAARAAGLRTVALSSGSYTGREGKANQVVERLDQTLIELIFG